MRLAYDQSRRLLTAYCLLLTAHCSLLTAHCLLHTPPVQPPHQLASPIRDDQIRAGAFEGEHLLEHGRALVEPAIRGGGFDHRVFARDIVDGGRQTEALFHPPDDVE